MAVAAVWAMSWAGAFVVTKLAIPLASPELVVGGRCAVAAVVLLALRASQLRVVPGRELVALGVLGLLNNVGYLGVIAFALPHLSAGLASILSACTPMLVLIAAAATGAQRLRTVQLLGLICGLGGIVLSALDRLRSGTVTAPAVAMGTGAVCALALATYLTPVLAGSGDALFATGWQALVGAVPLLSVGLVARPHFEPSVALIAAVAALGLGASLIGMSLWLVLIRRVGAASASVAHFLPPLFGLALGALVLGEPVTGTQLLAVIPVAAGVVLATRTSPSPPSPARLPPRDPDTAPAPTTGPPGPGAGSAVATDGSTSASRARRWWAWVRLPGR